MITLIFSACCLLAGFQEDSGNRAAHSAASKASLSELPTAQEKLLAGLLAELPEERRAELIAQALANSRRDAQEASKATSLASPSGAMPMALDKSLHQQFGLIQDDQRLLALELKSLRAESQLLKDKFDSLTRNPERGSANPPQRFSQTFVLPRFQRPGLPPLAGPFVNQPSGPMIVIEPAPDQETEQAITLELAQLSRDMFRLNQRLQQLQGNAEISRAPMVLNQPSKESAEQAKRPTPLLPR